MSVFTGKVGVVSVKWVWSLSECTLASLSTSKCTYLNDIIRTLYNIHIIIHAIYSTLRYTVDLDIFTSKIFRL